MQYIEMYSGFIHLDFDKLTTEQLEQAKKVIAAILYTFLCFVSPSGNGLKVFVEVTTGMEHHDIAYQQVQHYYEKATGLKADPSSKDITRLCFMSHDPHLHKNIQNSKFEVVVSDPPKAENIKQTAQTAKPVQEEQQEPEDLNASFIFNQQVQFTNQNFLTKMETVTTMLIPLLPIVTVQGYLNLLLVLLLLNILIYLTEKFKRR